MKKFFVTGTDTNVGKTFVSAILAYALQAYYWKPIQAGMEELDKETVQFLTGLEDTHFIPSRYVFKMPACPSHAARHENITIDLDLCQLPSVEKPLIVEGAGGIYVPLNNSTCVIDMIKRFELPTIIVARGTLGTINHTLLTIKTLQRHQIPISGIIFNGELDLENQRTIEEWCNVRTLLHVPTFPEISRATLQTWVHTHQSLIQEKFLC